MLSSADWDWMREQAAAVRADREVSVVLRRNNTELTAQDVRIEAVGRGYKMQSDAGRESRNVVVMFGAEDLDVEVEDRFTHDGVIYRVVFVSVNRAIDTQAECVAVQ